VATRVSPEDLAEIERLAGRLDVPPSSLLRGWILSGLNAHKDETVQSTIERISADVQRLRELVARPTGPADTADAALPSPWDASAAYSLMHDERLHSRTAPDPTCVSGKYLPGWKVR
jgi:hypothetical protein